MPRIELNSESQFFLEKVLSPLVKDEIYFISLSCRNKYLDDNERQKYALSRTEMFAREVVTKNNTWDYVFRKLDGLLSAKRTKTGFEFPEKALVTYVNINPSSAIKAVLQFKEELAKAEELLIRKTILNGKEVNEFDFDFFKTAKAKLYNAYQRQTSRKEFIDIDVDIKNFDIVKIVLDELVKNDGKYVLIETRGGYHVMIQGKSIRGNYVYTSVEHAKRTAFTKTGVLPEIMFNPNAMVPVPGTLHGGFMVKVLENKL